MIVNGTRLLSTEFSRLLKRRCQKLCSVFNKWVWIVSSQPWRAPLLWLTSSRFSASILRKKFHLLYILWGFYSKTNYGNVSGLRSGKIGLLEINKKYKSSHYWNSKITFEGILQWFCIIGRPAYVDLIKGRILNT